MATSLLGGSKVRLRWYVHVRTCNFTSNYFAHACLTCLCMPRTLPYIGSLGHICTCTYILSLFLMVTVIWWWFSQLSVVSESLVRSGSGSSQSSVTSRELFSDSTTQHSEQTQGYFSLLPCITVFYVHVCVCVQMLRHYFRGVSMWCVYSLYCTYIVIHCTFRSLLTEEEEGGQEKRSEKDSVVQLLEAEVHQLLHDMYCSICAGFSYALWKIKNSTLTKAISL